MGRGPSTDIPESGTDPAESVQGWKNDMPMRSSQNAVSYRPKLSAPALKRKTMTHRRYAPAWSGWRAVAA